MKTTARTAAVAALISLASGCATGRPERAGAADISGDLFEKGAGRPPSAETLYTMARILEAQGKDAVQEFLLGRIIEEHPRFLPAYSSLARLRMRQERIREAAGVLQTGLRQAPDDPVLINDLGMCRLLEESYDEALGHFTRAAALDPDESRYRANMAVALGMMGRYDECLSLYAQVVPPWDAHHNLAVLCEARSDRRRAAEEHRRARRLRLGLEAP
jgi:tetratricopeptide (TPR) repeat protein